MASTATRRRRADGEENAVWETAFARNSRRSPEGTMATSPDDSNEASGLGVEKIDPTTGWIAPLGFRTLKAMS
jgi:hypothetical protein